MKKRYVIFIVLIVVLFVGILTNPSKEDYLTYTKEQGIKNSDNFLEKGVYTFFSSSMVDAATTTKNYAVFSIYETELGGGKVAKVIGAFNNFFCIDDEAKEVLQEVDLEDENV